MGKPPAFQMYAADFDMDTGSWTNPQVGVYIRLLLYSWVNGSIPNNMAQLSRIARIDVRNMHKMWSTVIAKKWTLTPENMYVNPRLETEREKQAMYSESQKQKGIKRAEKMWEGHIAVAKKRLQPKHSSSSSTSSSIKNKTYTGEFISFWNLYPRKTGKDAAWKAWVSRNGDRPDIGVIMDAIRSQIGSVQWQKDNGQFIPNPATWINQGRWNDEPGRGTGNGSGGSRVSTTPPEWKPEAPLSDEQIRANQQRVKALIAGEIAD